MNNSINLKSGRRLWQKRGIIALQLLLTAGLVFGTYSPKVEAQSAVGINITPTTFEFSVNPGETQTNQIKVTNVTNETLHMEAKVENISGVGDRGQVSLTPEETEFSLSSWVSTNPSQFILGPREVKLISFTIKVPPKAEPGGHYGSILISTVASDNPESTGSSIAQKLGTLLLIRVAGKARESGVVNSFQTKTFDGKWQEVTTDDGITKVLVPDMATATNSKPTNYFNTGPVAFDLKIKNNGNVHFRPLGFITIYNIFGKKVAEQAVEQRNVFPGTERSITVIWPQKTYWGIKYRAQYTGVYGQSNQAQTAETSFWAFPLVPAVIILVVFVLGLVLRKRVFRAIRILISGK